METSNKKSNPLIWFCILSLLLIFIVSLFYGLEKVGDAEFVCTNGDYQNYNVVKRFLAGQAPYTDFNNYLGMGPILLTAPLIFINNSFSFNLFVTNFVACACFIVFVASIFYLVTGDRIISMLFGLLMPKLISSNIISLIPLFGKKLDYYLNLLAKPANSFRIGRLFLPIAQVLIFGLIVLVLNRSRRQSLVELLRSKKAALVVGGIVGLGITWSNDFGFSCIGTTILIELILSFVDWGKGNGFVNSFTRFLGLLPGITLGVILSATVASGGGAIKYLSATRDVAGWQFWYFGYRKGDKIYSFLKLLTDVKPATKFSFIIYFIAMAACLYCLIKGKAGNRMVLLVYSYTAVMAAHFLYLVGSGSDEFREGSFCYSFFLILALIVAFALREIDKLGLTKLMNMIAIVSLVIYGVFIIYKDANLFLKVRQIDYSTDSNYVKELGGVNDNATYLYEMNEIVGDDEFFSTYATALNDMKNYYQPTGCDYIIHALGKEGFEAYKELFNSNVYQYVQTTNTYQWIWERWTSRASWTFYKELYSNYTYHSDHGLWTLWEYASENAYVVDGTGDVEVIQNLDGSTTIYITTNVDYPVYANVVLTYENKYINNLNRLFTYNSAVFVEDYSILPFDGYYLPRKVENLEIGVYINNGIGEITLYGEPIDCTKLNITNIYLEELIEVQKDYFEYMSKQ